MTEPEEVVKDVAEEAARKAASETGNAVSAEVNRARIESETTETAAEAAVALAAAASTAASIDVVERERQLIGRVETWQTEQREFNQALTEKVTALEGGISAIVSAVSSMRPPQSSQAKSDSETVDPEQVKPDGESEADPPDQKTTPQKRRRRFI